MNLVLDKTCTCIKKCYRCIANTGMWLKVPVSQQHLPLWTVAVSLASLLSPVNHNGDCACMSWCFGSLPAVWNAIWVDVRAFIVFGDNTLLAVARIGSFGSEILCRWLVIMLSILLSIQLSDSSLVLQNFSVWHCWRRSSLACIIIYKQSIIKAAWKNAIAVQLILVWL